MPPQFYAFIGYLAAAAIEAFAYARLLTPKLGRIRTPLVQTAAAAGVMLMIWPVLLDSSWRVFLVLPLFFLILALLYRDPLPRKLGLFVFMYLLELTADLACWPLLLQAADTKSLSAVNAYSTSARSLLIRCCYLAILFFLITCLVFALTHRKPGPVQEKNGFLLSLTAGAILAQIIFMGIMTFGASQTADASLFGVMLPLAAGSFLLLYIFLRRFTTYVSGRTDASTAASQQEMLARHREDLRRYQEADARIRRQLKRTVDELEEALLSGSLQAVDALAEKPDGTGDLRQYSESHAVNSLLLAKAQQAEERRIRLTLPVCADLPPLGEFPMCAILSNLLDNAIRAAGVCTGERWIRLQRFERAGLCGLICENTACPGTVRRISAGDHGLGLSIVRSITQSYGGTMDVRREDGVFTVVLSFLLP